MENPDVVAETVSNTISFLGEWNIDGIGKLIILCMVAISMATSYIQLFHASQFEAIFMSKNEGSKRYFVAYVILFFMFGVTNYLFITDSSFFMVNLVVLVGAFLTFLFIYFILERKGISKKLRELRDNACIIMLITSTAVSICTVSAITQIDNVSLVIIGSLVEVLVIAMAFLNTSKTRTVVTVTIKGEKWYVFKRIDEEHLLCGNNCIINASTRTRLIKICDIVEGNLCFEKEEKEDKGKETKAEEATPEDAKTEEIKTQKAKPQKGKVITVRIRI